MSLKIYSTNTYTSQIAKTSSTEDCLRLPREIWEIIIGYLKMNSGLKHVATLAFVSKNLLRTCLDSFANFKILNALSQITFPPIASLKKSFYECVRFSCFGYQRLLAVDDKERQYSYSRRYSCRDSLVIMDHKNLKSIITLNLTQQISQAKGDLEEMATLVDGYCSPYAQQIVACYPVEGGFIVVTRMGYSMWKYQDDRPLLQGFFTPFETYEDHHEIQGSSFHNGMLLIKIFQNESNEFKICDTKMRRALFSKVEIVEELDKLFSHSHDTFGAKSFFVYLHHMEGRSFLLYENKRIIHILEIEICKSKMEFSRWVIAKKGEPTTIEGTLFPDSLPRSTSEWTLYFRHRLQEDDKELLYVLKENKIWMGEDFALQLPHEDKNDHYLIYEDFLFLSYRNGNWRLIYLPTKYEFYFQGDKELKAFLAKKDATLFKFSIELSKEGTWQLKVIFQIFVHDVRVLHSLIVPLNNELEL